MKKNLLYLAVLTLLISALIGCANQIGQGNSADSQNIIITESGEVMELEEEQILPTAKPTPEPEIVSDEVVFVEEPLEEPVIEQTATEIDEVDEENEHRLQIVFLGDSILDGYRDVSGIAYLTGQACDAKVYNLAIGGTSAAAESGDDISSENWDSLGLNGIVNAMSGGVDTDFLEGYRAGDILKQLDNVENTDYFVVAYGLNDFFMGVPQNNPERDYDITTYAGALRVAIKNLRKLAPDATVILCSPNYAQFFVKGVFIGDGNVVNTGNGTLFDYKGTCEYVAKEQDTLFLDAYLGLGIDGYTADEYLEDGVHLSHKGRALYADALSKKIIKYEETKNN